MTSSGSSSGTAPTAGGVAVPAPRRARGGHRTPADELVLLAQAVDVLSVRVAVSGGLATGVRARALGLHLATAAAAVRDHTAVQRDVVLPVLGSGDHGEHDASVAELRAGAERVLGAVAAVTAGAQALLEQTAGVGVLQTLGIATRTLWSAAVEHDRAWAALAAPRARQLIVERRCDTGSHRLPT